MAGFVRIRRRGGISSEHRTSFPSKLVASEGVPVVLRGAGTSLAEAIPVEGGICRFGA